MKRHFLPAAFASTLLAVAAHAGPVNATIYQSYSDPGGGLTFGPQVGTVTSNDFNFYTDNSGYWYPLGRTYYGADIKAEINVATSGNYTFSDFSDDASYMFIDSGLVFSDGGNHGYAGGDFTVYLTAGDHLLESEFGENGAGPGGIDVSLPKGVTYAAPDAASTGACLGAAVLGLGLLKRKRAAAR